MLFLRLDDSSRGNRVIFKAESSNFLMQSQLSDSDGKTPLSFAKSGGWNLLEILALLL